MGGQEEAGVNFKQASGLLTGEGTALTDGGVLSNSDSKLCSKASASFS